jgi:squalene synthase HpnC
MSAVASGHRQDITIADAFAYCERLCRTHYENFTVVARFIPRDLRRHFHSIYAFCRFVDDLGDEAAGDRLALLDEWEADLRRCYGDNGEQPQHPIHVALRETIRQFAIPATPFLKLIEANRMDQRRRRHPTYADLLHYCDHSANPVGHLVLYLLGYRDAERQRLSDAICTGLQLANFWQDVQRDLAMDRIYIPLEDMARFGYSESDLQTGVVDDRFRGLMRFEVERARALFAAGRPLADMVHGVARWQLRLYSAGGLAVLQAIERLDYDVLHQRPALSKADKARLAMQALLDLMSSRLLHARGR